MITILYMPELQRFLCSNFLQHNVSGTTQTSFFARFKATLNKIGPKRHRYSVPKTSCALRYITDNKLKQLFSRV